MSNQFGYIAGTMHFPYIFGDQKDKFDRFSMVLTLEGDELKNVRQLGLKVLQNPEKFDGLPYISLKSSYPPALYNADKTPYSGPTRLQNGSKAVAKVSQRAYDNKFGKGTTTFMAAVLITDPIEFIPTSQGGEASGHFDDAPTTVMPKASKPGTVAKVAAPPKAAAPGKSGSAAAEAAIHF